VRRLIRATLAAGLLAVSPCGGGAPTSEQSVEVAGVTVAATPERVDATGAVLQLKLDTPSTPLDMDLPAAAHLSVGGPGLAGSNVERPGARRIPPGGNLAFSPAGPAEGPVRLVVGGLGEPAVLTWTEVPR
jgi:hypothetical protein